MEFTESQQKIIQKTASYVAPLLNIDFTDQNNFRLLIEAIVNAGWEDGEGNYINICSVEYTRHELFQASVLKHIHMHQILYSKKYSPKEISVIQRMYESRILQLFNRLQSLLLCNH